MGEWKGSERRELKLTKATSLGTKAPLTVVHWLSVVICVVFMAQFKQVQKTFLSILGAVNINV